MDIDENQILLLKKKLKIIKQYKGQGTQLISLYLPPDADRSSVMKQLTDEISQSANIKSQQTRKNVQGALRRIMNYLKQIDFRLPETGLVLFSGEVSPTPSKSNIILMEIVPPKRLTTKLYWCDSSFHTAPLDEMITTEDVFGLIVIDKREATIGVLRGKSQEILGHETSGVPGKFRAGGQCLKEGFVCLSNGDLISLDDCQEKQSIKSIDFNNFESEDSLILDKWNVKKNKTYDISTEFPSLEIQSSKDHLFFVCTNDGIKEKCAEELKIGDYLLMPEKINVKGKLQKLKFITPFTKNSTITKNNLPNVLNNDFAQFVGYLIGTGSVENNNISFFEKDKQVVFVYKKKYEHFFKISSNYKFRKNKNDYLLQFTNKSLINLIQTEFPEIKNTIDTTMPKKILQSPNPIVASFLKGLFDAGGDVSVKPSGVYFSTNNKKLAHQIQLVFLRFSIICSFYNFDNITNPYTKNKKYTITINDKKSLKLFKKHINFTNKTKQNNLNKIIVTTVTNNDNYKKQLLNNINKKNIVLYKKIKQFYDSPIIPIKINKINIINEISNMVDISVQNQN
ncbi:MAG TPA: LAGLIDADG family homing endonuclease, partial [Candidatus Diapherotrites archaeon]|nr:LAGLIDADG family homing endonuclease [Candidatus Diapherotrites archaeon]